MSVSVLRARVKRLQGAVLHCKRAKVLKLREGIPRRQLRRPSFRSPDLAKCCGQLRGQLLVMGSRASDGRLVPLLIVPWRRSPSFRKALKVMRGVDCSNPLVR